VSQATAPPGASGSQPAATPAPDEPAPRPHEPFLRRLRRAGRDPAAFRRGQARTWFAAGIAALAVLAVLPFAAPALSTLTARIANLLALVFLLAAAGLWMGMRGRAFAVSAAFVVTLYALTSWTPLAFPLIEDFFVLAVLVSFAIFALAGFNLVFVLEEVVYDAHVRLHVAGRVWAALPTAACVLLVLALPAWRAVGGPDLPALWTAAVVGALLLLFWWAVAWANDVRDATVLRELHLFVVGALAATALADSVRAFDAVPKSGVASLVPSLLAYLVLIGTWVYSSYTTLQRTHFLLKGENWRPWAAILMGASFAILAHAQVLVAQAGRQAVFDLADERVAYLVAGVWIGIAFYGARGLNRVFRFVQRSGLGARSQKVVRQAERVTGGLARTEQVLQDTALVVFRSIDHVIPGKDQPPQVPLWRDGPVRVRGKAKR